MGVIQDIVQSLVETRGDPDAQAAAAAEFVVSARPEGEREALRAALDAAAVLRWFDTELLARLLDLTEKDAGKTFDTLIPLPFIERYRVNPRDLRNVQKSTRLGWRKQLASRAPQRLRDLSARAQACFADDLTPAGRIEWIYHLLISDSGRGADELEALDRRWSSAARPEDRSLLAAALNELDGAGLLQGRARVWALLVVAWTRAARGEVAQLSDLTSTILDLARASADTRAEADALCLRGDLMQAHGNLPAAQESFEESLSISRRMAEQDPSNAGWQRDLAVVHSWVGGVLKRQNNLQMAEDEFGNCLSISRKLAEQDPSNAGWQRDLAMAYSWVGDVLQAQNKLEKAQAAFGSYLSIISNLVEQDPNNGNWQRDLAVAHRLLGGVLQARGKLEEAQAAFGEHLSILHRLAEQDPSNARWLRNLAAAHRQIGDVLQSQDKLDAAQAAFGEYLSIIRRLAEQDPSNVGWQRDLAMAYSRVGDVLQAQGNLAAAQAAFGDYLSISRKLADQDPENAGMQRALAVACRRVASLKIETEDPRAALPLYEEASRILSALVERSPTVARWKEDKQLVEAALARCIELIETDRVARERST